MKNYPKKFVIFPVLFISAFFLFSGCEKADIPIGKTIQKISQPAEFAKPEVKKREPISIIFLGDIMLDRYIRQIAEKKGYDFILEKVSDFLKSSDLAIANLEGPVTSSPSRSINTQLGEKANYYFTFNFQSLSVLKENNIRLVNIGNNHISNFGAEGIAETKNYLNVNGIEFFGDTTDENNCYIIKEIKSIKIGLVSHNQFFGGQEKSIECLAKIKLLKPDFIVVYAHWGKEYEKEPLESVRNLAREFIDNGADLVIGSHPHIVQWEEEYKNKKIFYSLGNFVFDQYFNPETRLGLAVKVIFNPENKTLDFMKQPVFMETSGQTVLK
ncbi:MAG: CapA family protein [Candidatus Moranbacteria bacterium]|nr:CapA family protein [Candidatus Moranbacteria bacterium]